MNLPNPQTRPDIQIGNTVREMTEEEYEIYLVQQQQGGASAGITDESIEQPTSTQGNT
jgi:hypothetical protein